MADYGETVLQGMQVGSSIYSRGAELALRRQQLESERATRQLQNEHIVQTMRLQMEQHDQDIKARAAALSAINRAQMESADNVSIPIELPGGETTSMFVPNPAKKPAWEAYQDNMLKVAAEFGGPKAAEDVIHNTVLMRMQEAHAKAYERQAAEDAAFKPGFQTLNDPSGTPHTIFQGSKNSAQIVDPPQIQNLTNPATGQTTPTLVTKGGQAKALPQDVEGRMINSDIRKQQDRLVKWVEENRSDLIPQLVTDARGFKTVPPELVPQVAKMAGLPVAERTKLIEEQMKGEDAFRIGRQLAELLPENSGVQGWWKKALVPTHMDKALGVENATDAYAADTLATVFANGIVKAIRTDSNIAEAERKTLASAVPSAERFQIDPRGELRRLETIIQTVAQKSRMGAQRMGTPINPVFLTPEEIKAQRDNGQISSEQAAAMLENSAAALLLTLRRMR